VLVFFTPVAFLDSDLSRIPALQSSVDLVPLRVRKCRQVYVEDPSPVPKLKT
jgi:hypothetical protein